MQFLVAALILLVAILSGRPICAAALERGTAITDPLALRELDGGRFGIGRMLVPERAGDRALTNDEMFALPSMQVVRDAIEAEFGRYVDRHRATLPNETIGVGDSFAFQLFDRSLLTSAQTQFVLAGIVNRMDRAFVDPASCGEIRLIYRLVRADTPARDGNVASSRLPMTFNVVLNARSEGGRMDVTCADIARRWLAAGELSLTGAELAKKLLAKDGPLALIDGASVARVETNLQIAHAPKSAVRDFRTDYLMKVFDFDASTRRFVEASLENQIDRDRILADENLKRDFRTWLLTPGHIGELDRGTVLIPERFLARRAIAPTPAGFDPSELQPEFGLVEGEGDAAIFGRGDVVDALERATESGIKLQNIQSPAGFARRLNDITCSGCHQTRGVGGFHFPGVDWMAERPSNQTVVPASPHFFGDQVRRRDILDAFARGTTPDFSRGFSSRPQLRGSTELAGTGYSDGWGAHCYQPGADAADNDRSFRNWTCAKGLTCQIAGKRSGMGMCFVQNR